MNIPDCINQLIQFREQVYKSFSHRGDSLMDLLDALCSTRDASSVAELSLNSLFRRGYSALYGAVQSLGVIEEETRMDGENPDSPTRRFPSCWAYAIADTVPAPEHRKYWLFGVIVFGQSRRQLSSSEVYQSYRQRFNLEHGIRFSKQHLMNGFGVYVVSPWGGGKLIHVMSPLPPFWHPIRGIGEYPKFK